MVEVCNGDRHSCRPAYVVYQPSLSNDLHDEVSRGLAERARACRDTGFGGIGRGWLSDAGRLVDETPSHAKIPVSAEGSCQHRVQTRIHLEYDAIEFLLLNKLFEIVGV